MMRDIRFVKTNDYHLIENFKKVARENAPDEVCGVLVGPVLDTTGLITRILMVKNISENIPKWDFIMDPVEFYLALKTTCWLNDNATDDYLGVIHSHPVNSSLPSIYDKAAVFNGHTTEGAYMIYSVRDDTLFCGIVAGGQIIPSFLAT